jgi:hypothetical protein
MIHFSFVPSDRDGVSILMSWFRDILMSHLRRDGREGERKEKEKEGTLLLHPVYRILDPPLPVSQTK